VAAGRSVRGGLNMSPEEVELPDLLGTIQARHGPGPREEVVEAPSVLGAFEGLS